MESESNLKRRLARGLAILLTGLAPTLSLAGGFNGSGGGNDTKPTDEDIRATVNRLSKDLEWARTTFNLPFWYNDDGDNALDARIQSKVDPAINQTLNRMRLWYLRNNRYGEESIPVHFQEEPCPSDDGDREASTQTCGGAKAPVCLSFSRIRESMPKATLRLSLQALLMHEVAHRECADEQTAKKIEHLFSMEMAQNSHLFELINRDVHHARYQLRQILRQLDGSGGSVTDAFLCSHIGRFTDNAFSIEEHIDLTSYHHSREYERLLKEERTNGPTDFIVGGFAMEKFCGESLASDAERSRIGDRAGLRAVVERQLVLIKKIENSFTSYIGSTIAKAMRGEF